MLRTGWVVVRRITWVSPSVGWSPCPVNWDDYPDTADWHASEEGQQERRQVATQDTDALNQFVDPAKARGLLDGVPGVKAITLGSAVGPMEGTTQDEARDAWAEREGITWWPEARDAELARQRREGIT
jgi:hypothetical protein